MNLRTSFISGPIMTVHEETHLRGAQRVLRSKTPDLVYQEAWGFLLTHFALGALMHEAALGALQHVLAEIRHVAVSASPTASGALARCRHRPRSARARRR